jgi:hypothetical protein
MHVAVYGYNIHCLSPEHKGCCMVGEERGRVNMKTHTPFISL